MTIVSRWAALFLLAAASGCTRSDHAPAPSASVHAVPVAAPVGLVAEFEVPDPRGLWSALRKLGGSRAAALPSSFELMLFSLLDLPPRVAGYVRPDTSVVGVALAAPGAPDATVLAVRLSRGAELVSELTSSTDAPLRADRDGSPVTLLVGSRPGAVLGVVDDWLLVGGEGRALRASGAYLARTLGARRAGGEPFTIRVERAALAGPVSASIRARWAALRGELAERDRAERQLKGRAPDLADPVALLSFADGLVAWLLELVASTERATLTFRPEPERAVLELALVPQKDGTMARSTAALEVGTLEPLFELPEGVAMAAFSRSSDAERRRAAETPADALRSALGSRLSEADAAPLAAAMQSFHRGRGPVSTFGAFLDGSLFVRQAVRDPKELERGILGLMRALGIPALAEPLEPLIGKAASPASVTRVAGVDGPVQRVPFVKNGSRVGYELLAHVRGTAATTVLGPRPRDVLVSIERPSGPSLGGLPAFQALARDRAPAALAIYASVPSSASPSRPAPLLGVFGTDAGAAVLELALSAPACAGLFERFGSP